MSYSQFEYKEVNYELKKPEVKPVKVEELKEAITFEKLNILIPEKQKEQDSLEWMWTSQGCCLDENGNYIDYKKELINTLIDKVLHLEQKVEDLLKLPLNNGNPNIVTNSFTITKEDNYNIRVEVLKSDYYYEIVRGCSDEECNCGDYEVYYDYNHELLNNYENPEEWYYDFTEEEKKHIKKNATMFEGE